MLYSASQERLNEKFLATIVSHFSVTEGYILYFPLGNLSVDCFFSFSILCSWLHDSCNLMLVSLSLFFVNSYVYSM